MKKILIAAVAGGLTVFVWTAIAHMATPLGTAGMSVFPPDQESKIVDAMKTGLPGSGLYFVPGIDMRSTPTPEQQKAWEAKIQAGPFGLLVFNARGGSPLSPAQLVTELASTMLAAAVAAYLASLMAGPMMTRAIAVALLALFASLSVGASYWNWYGFPTAFVAAEALTELIGWLLGGLVISRLVPAARVPASTGLPL
jgi:hypothetical protein